MSKKVFKVTDGPLSVRSEPGGDWIKQYENGTNLEVDDTSRTESGGYVWWRHSEGWSAEKALDGSKTFMTAVDPATTSIADPVETSITSTETTAAVTSPAEAPTTTWMQVGQQDVRIRSAPSVRGTAMGWVSKGSQIEVDLSSRTDADGFVWVKHAQGWSVEKNKDGTKVFMAIATAPSTTSAPSQADLFAVSGPVTSDTVGMAVGSPADTTTQPETTKATEAGPVETTPAVETTPSKLQAQQGVKTRNAPSLSGQPIDSAYIQRGTIIDVDPASRTTVDGYVWIKHSAGWSAIQSTDGRMVFLVEVGSVPGLVAIDADGPKIEDLPEYKTMITRSPVDIAQTQWFQYFGNNVFAVTDGSRFGYDRYSQGLHGGLDFGNSAAAPPIFAGLNCTYSETKNTSPNLQIWAKSGDFTIIWQHIRNPSSFAPGQPITPDTRIGEIEPGPKGFSHLHFEIRYQGVWIVNPLAFMTDAVFNQITGKFSPKAPRQDGKSVLKYFYQAGGWNKWLAPLDQPSIKLGGPVIGPKAQ